MTVNSSDLPLQSAVLKNQSVEQRPERRGFFSDEEREVFQFIFVVVIRGSVGFLGCFANGINIAVFLKQGLHDSVTISLLALAVSDSGIVLTMVWSGISKNPLMMQAQPQIPFILSDLEYLTAGWPHIICTRISGWLTVYITLERCLCVVFPLKVKGWLRPRRTAVMMVSIYVLNLVAMSPTYYHTRLRWMFYPHLNDTYLGLIFTEGRVEAEHRYYFPITHIALPITCFILISLFTAVLTVRLNSNIKWRASSTGAGQGRSQGQGENSDQKKTGKESASISKDRRVAKMVTIVSSIFILCMAPSCFIFFLQSLETELRVGGVFENEVRMLFSLVYVLETVCASVNIFVYLTMSSRYRLAFYSLFPWLFGDKDETDKETESYPSKQ